jgi:hypothetical protein
MPFRVALPGSPVESPAPLSSPRPAPKGLARNLDGYTLAAMDPVTHQVEYAAGLSEEDAWARVAALAPAPPLLVHRPPGSRQARATRCFGSRTLSRGPRAPPLFPRPQHGRGCAVARREGTPVHAPAWATCRAPSSAEAGTLGRVRAPHCCPRPPCGPQVGARPVRGSQTDFEARARAAMGLAVGHRNSVRAYESADGRRGFEQQALLLLGEPADTPVARVQARHRVPGRQGDRAAQARGPGACVSQRHSGALSATCAGR